MRQLDIQPLDDARRPIKIGLIVAGAFVALIGLFALLAPVSGAAIASAEVTVAGDTFAIQPTGSGIVSEVLVREGQAVVAGQPLVRLNGVRSGATLRQAQAKRDALRALEARLIAERDGATTLLFPEDLASRSSDPGAAKAMAAQQAIFAKHMPILAADRGTADQSVTAARAKHEAAKSQLTLISAELADYRSLYAKGFARLTTVRSLERTQAQLRAEVIASEATSAQSTLAQQRVRDSQGMEIAAQLGQVQEQLAQVQPSLDVSRYLADQDMLRAPAAGRVSGVTKMGPGMVISGGRTLMQIIPDGRPMIVEARVKPQDIDDVRIGQEAMVRFSTVNPHGQSAFVGKVMTLSPARITEGNASFFKAQIALVDPEGARKAGLVLQPGIPASVNIKTKDRTLFDYLFQPFTDAMSRSFREE
ncbi:MAG: HlyD family type I secretion periplasmic adaptor subunit [Sphingomonadales bacterium]|nr:MAG: HlyD family type I secretion periplasmic adaptor subunit [Sphingomonadales bacterium]